MSDVSKLIAQSLLKVNAIKLQPSYPFTWASGWKSPIYCDNRVTLSYHDVRTLIRDEFVKVVKKEFPEVEIIAGVATGAIAQGVLVADAMEQPFIYIRSAAKGHGMENLIEGEVKPGQKVVVIEDLISTGGSSLKAVEALRAAGCEVLGMVAIFTYGFQTAIDNFEKAKVTLLTLSNYNALAELALETKYITELQFGELKQWRVDPSNWGK
jgi:orotate phosphoribosyltransferase